MQQEQQQIEAPDARDTWRDRNADSGLRLAHWLSESDERNIRHDRWNDPLLGTVWTIELVDDGERVASGRDHHLDEAWVKALESLDATRSISQSKEGM